MAYSECQQINREAEKQLLDFMASQCQSRWYMELRSCVPQLLCLLEEAQYMSHHELSQRASQILSERCQCDEGGDCLSHSKVDLARESSKLGKQLSRMVHERPYHTDCSNAQVPPVMFG